MSIFLTYFLKQLSGRYSRGALVVCLILSLSPGKVSANDAVGGTIWYEFAGDSLNPYTYNVFIEVYALRGYALLPNNFPHPFCISSSCFPSINASANFIGVFNLSPPYDTVQGTSTGSILTPYLNKCIDTNSNNNIVNSEILRWGTTITLPGKCTYIKFSTSGFQRVNYDNLVGANNGLFISAELNNFNGPNSSPTFASPAAKSFCVGHEFNWLQHVIESDGDSLLFELSPAQSINSSQCNFVNIPYAAGYSVSQPLTSLHGVTLDQAKGSLNFKTVKQENVAFNLKVTEFRKTSGYWFPIGNVDRAVQINIAQDCNPNIMYGPSYDTTTFPFQLAYKDSILGYGFSKVFVRDSIRNSASPNDYLLKVPTLRYNCFDSIVSVNFESDVWCESIAADGSDFRLVGPDSILIPNIGIGYNCGNDGYVSRINILLHKPIDVNGDYMLFVKTGNDGNTLIGRCSFQVPNLSMAIVKVEDCPIPDYELINVSVMEDKQVRLHWEADSATYSKMYFNSWQIFRSDSSFNGFYPVGNVVIDSARFFIDSSLAPEILDAMSFEYNIKLGQNFTPRNPSKSISTVLLRATVPDTNNPNLIKYYWTDYNGWLDPHFEIFIARIPSFGQSINWLSLNGPNHNFYDFDYQFQETTLSNEGIIMAKVVATNPSDTVRKLKSESNWVLLDFVYEPPTPDDTPSIISIPNIFTPNGDGQNDFFKIESDFQKVNISIYNRWGELVFEESTSIVDLSWDGRHHKSLQPLSDGVYYYVASFTARLNDGCGNYSTVKESRKGSLTLIGN